MTDAVLRAAGVGTGLFTSPHLCRFTERIRIDGQEIDGDRLAALDAAVVATGVPLTYFEVSAVLGLLAMADAKVEVAVLEVGLGGRLDATTAVTTAEGPGSTSMSMERSMQAPISL
jgi:dihydrofolate synthase/folylpolyglutamate synthase